MAAQDPNNKVTPEDAEGIMTDESKKAGIPAFQFDPNASPEEKAAQARSVSFPFLHSSLQMPMADLEKHVPPGFHHDKKPKGVGIATDVVSRPDQYNKFVLISNE